MKFIVPAAFAFLTIACVAPPAKPGTEAHQRQLAEEARKNFYALKEQERKAHPPVVVAEAEPSPNKLRLTPFQPNRPDEYENPAPHMVRSKPAPTPKAAKPAGSLSLFARHEQPRRADGTLYLYDMPHGPEPESARYRAYKIQYARELAKRPEDLTSEEREWVRRHYRDH